MIPDRDEFWLISTPMKFPPGPSVASGPLDHQTQQKNGDSTVGSSGNEEDRQDLTESTKRRGDTAWKRYCSYVESMASRGQKINQRLAIEAMFLGKNLIYRAQSSTPQDCSAL